MSAETGTGTNKNVIAGRYEMLERIGQGGMSKVYKGRDLSLDRIVAIKLLRDEYGANPDFVERFLREARSIASLTGDYIINIYDYGQDGDTYYIISEFVDGSDLKALIQQSGRLSPERATEIMRNLLLALKPAHDAGIIHRDVKPQNILVSKNGIAKLADFGIARVRDSVQMTKTGAIMGTASYMSPEQARGEKVNHQADLYAAGIVLYEMLTGALPFHGDTTLDTLMAHLHQPIPDLSGLPPRLAKVTRRALAKTTAERYKSADEMLADLDTNTTSPGYSVATSEETAYSPVVPPQLNQPVYPTQPPVNQPQYAPLPQNTAQQQYAPPPQNTAQQQYAPPQQYAVPQQNYGQVPQEQVRERETGKSRAGWLLPLFLLLTLLVAGGIAALFLLRNPENPQPTTTANQTATPGSPTTAAARATTAAPQTTQPAQQTRPVNVNIAAGQLDGAYERDDKTLFGRTNRALYGAGSGYNEGRITLNLDAAPPGAVTLRLTGLDDERQGVKCDFEVVVNDRQVFRGANSFPDTPRTDNGLGGSDRLWGGMSVEIPAGVLKAGRNTIVLRNNTPWSGQLGIPYVLINALSLNG
jgi:serine/threonine protein kinase